MLVLPAEKYPMRQAVSAVVFDMDDVLCDYRFDLRLEGIATLTGHTPAEVQALIWDSGFDEDGDRGKYDAEAYLREFNRRLDSDLSAAQWMEVRRISTVPEQAVLDMARAVGRKRSVALLTNNGPLFKRGMAQIFPALLEIFGEHAYCAYEFGGAKPETKVFEGVAAALGVSPRAMFFIDDTEEYIAGAASIGVQAHLFENPEALREALENRGLL